MLEKGQADLSILFTTDPQLSAESDKFVILEDDKEVFPAGNVIFVTDQNGRRRSRARTTKRRSCRSRKGLTLPVMQELDARVELEKETPKEAARRIPRRKPATPARRREVRREGLVGQQRGVSAEPLPASASAPLAESVVEADRGLPRRRETPVMPASSRATRGS